MRPLTRSRPAVGEAVRQLRCALGETQQQFAHRVGMAVASIARYETSRWPSRKAIERFEQIAVESGHLPIARRFAQMRGEITETTPADGCATKHEPPPIRNTHPAIWDLVISDMQARDKTGEKNYGTRLQPFNGRNALVDAYQEALDLAVYLRQAIYEQEIGAPSATGRQ